MKGHKLNIVFFGSSEFAASILKTLVSSGYELACVITQPDKKAGRHLEFTSTPVKVWAKASDLKILTPVDLSEPEFLQSLSALRPELFIVASYGEILPSKLLEIPRLFAVNIHASLLPKYRGAAPIQWAIIKGEKESGITFIKMSEKMDEGDIILSKRLPIEITDNAISLEAKLASLASKEIFQVLKLIEENKVSISKQDSSIATYAPKLKKGDGLIDWKNDALTIYNQIRGFLPWPVAFTFFRGKRVKIFSAKVSCRTPVSASTAAAVRPGEIISLDNGLISVSCAKDIIKIEVLQLENAKRLNSIEFISGQRIKVGDFFG